MFEPDDGDTEEQVMETALIILEEGCGLVRTVRIGPMKVANFVAGTVPLNGQLVADLINMGWLKPQGHRDYFMVGMPPIKGVAAGRDAFGGRA